MEKGLAAGAKVHVKRSSGYVYDLVEHAQVDAGSKMATCTLPPN